MRLSHKYKFIFISIPKTATTTIRYALDDVSDIKSEDGSEKDFYHHVSANKLKSIFKKNSWPWDEYFKFTVVRNPFERIVSQYFYWLDIASSENQRHDDKFYLKCKRVATETNDFNGFVRKFSNCFDKPMFDLVTSDFNYYIKKEKLQADFDIVCDKIGIPQKQLSYKNKTEHKHYSEYYDEKSKAIVAEKYAKDIEMTGYEFEGKIKSFIQSPNNLEKKNKDVQKKKKPGFSLVTCSMNRTKYLLESIQTWNEIEELNEIIVVDYSSDKPILESDLPKPKFGKKIILVRVNNEKRWVLSHAYNLGISFAQYDKLLKIDSDIKLLKDFISSHPLKENVFYRGHWANARNENEIHFNGQLICNTSDFFAVNGYNERITTYGYDDTDLYIRIEQTTKSKPKDFDYDKMNHIESNSEVRVKNQNINVKKRFAIADLFENQQIEQGIVDELIWVPFPDNGEDLRLFLETQINRIRCDQSAWSINDSRIEWKVDALSDTIYNCERR